MSAGAPARRSLVLLAPVALAAAVVVAVVLLLVGLGPLALLVSVVAGVGAAAAVRAAAPGRALAPLATRDPDGRADARLLNLVEGLCVASGLPAPALRIVEAPGRNAMASGLAPERTTLVVTRGLLDALTRVELEAVLAHELSRVKAGDTVPGTVAVTAAGWLPAPLADRLLDGVADPRRVAVADVAAVQLTRYPPGLVAALAKLRDGGTEVPGASRATAHLWLASPLPAGAGGVVADGAHPDLDLRIVALEEL